jgi:ribose 5-phosphate isomerase A
MEDLKKRAADEAITKVRDGMVVGLGTGSTARYAIEGIGKMVSEGLDIVGIPTSVQSLKIASANGIKLVDISDYDVIDITIDGADQVNESLNLIKGGGGALLREKIVGSISAKEVIIVDKQKFVSRFTFPLPVETIPFGCRQTAAKLKTLGLNPLLRKSFKTDNGNYILDCHYQKIDSLSELETKINNIPGVVENGLFIDIADEIIIGDKPKNTILRKIVT